MNRKVARYENKILLAEEAAITTAFILPRNSCWKIICCVQFLSGYLNCYFLFNSRIGKIKTQLHYNIKIMSIFSKFKQPLNCKIKLNRRIVAVSFFKSKPFVQNSKTKRCRGFEDDDLIKSAI